MNLSSAIVRTVLLILLATAFVAATCLGQTESRPSTIVSVDPKMKEFQALMDSAEQGMRDKQARYRKLLDTINKKGGYDKLTGDEQASTRNELGVIVKETREAAEEFHSKQFEVQDYIEDLNRESSRQELTLSMQVEGINKTIAALKKDARLDQQEKVDIEASFKDGIASLEAQRAEIGQWAKSRLLVSKKIESCFARVEYCVEILKVSEEILTKGNTVGTALARLDAYVANLQEITISMAKMTRSLVNPTLPKT